MTESYLLDSSVILELIRNRPKAVEWLKSIPSDSLLTISGWTLIEFLKEKKSRQEMREVIAKFQQYQIVWPAPERCNEIFTLLVDKYHSERNPDGTLKGNAIFDALIYLTTKSYDFTLVTMDSGFSSFKDIKIIKLKSS